LHLIFAKKNKVFNAKCKIKGFSQQKKVKKGLKGFTGRPEVQVPSLTKIFASNSVG